MTASTLTTDVLGVGQWPRVGAVTLRAIVAAFQPRSGEPLEAFAMQFLAARAPDRAAIDAARSEAQRILEDCAERGITLISALDPAYPSALRSIHDWPAILYVRGDPAVLSRAAVAVVGTREASPRGRACAYAIGGTLASRGYCVVSGLALGIDTAAHSGALAGRGPTVAVLAHGLDTISPATNRALAEAILAAGGACVSEHPPGVPPIRAEFVRRNRIQSGLSLCSVIVESAREGGAIHQARFTRAQHRPLFVVVPTGDAGGMNLEGARFLIETEGAAPIASTEHLFERVRSLREAGVTPSAPLTTFEFGS